MPAVCARSQTIGSSRTPLLDLTFETFTPEPTRAYPPEQAATLHWAYETLARAYEHLRTCTLDESGRLAAPDRRLWLRQDTLGRSHRQPPGSPWGEPVVFMTAPDLLDHLRAAFGPQQRDRPTTTLFDQPAQCAAADPG